MSDKLAKQIELVEDREESSSGVCKKEKEEEKIRLKDQIRIIYQLLLKSRLDSICIYYPVEELSEQLDSFILTLMRYTKFPLYQLPADSNIIVNEQRYHLFYSDPFIKMFHVNHLIYGPLLTLSLRELFVVDIDSDCSFFELKQQIESNPRLGKELFYVHKTPNGFHLYLLSRWLNIHSSESMLFRLLLNSDIRHLIFGCSSGDAIRLTKKHVNEPFVSKRVGEIGTGELHSEILKVYQKVDNFLEMFQNENPETVERQSCLKKMFTLWESIYKDCPQFGQHYLDASLLKGLKRLGNGDIVMEDVPLKFKPLKWNQCNIVKRCSKFDDTLLYKSHQFFIRQNIFILESREDYLITWNCHYNIYAIAFKDLLVLDFDRKDLLPIVYEFVKLNPDYTFRVVETQMGYHLFLTSFPILYSDEKSYRVQNRLMSDRYYNAQTQIKGYVVRLNRKYGRDNEQYSEHSIIGKATESPRLLKLYRLHLELAQEYSDKVPMNTYYHNRYKIPMKLMDHIL